MTFTCSAASALPSNVCVSCLPGQARKGRLQRNSAALFYVRSGESYKANKHNLILRPALEFYWKF